MNLSPTRCVAASAAGHGLLLLVLVLAPGFASKKPDLIDVPTLDVIPRRAIDQDFNHPGGSPAAASSPAPAASSPSPQAAPTPPAPPPARPPVQPRPEVRVAQETRRIQPPTAEPTPPKVKVAPEPAGRQKLLPTPDGDQPSSSQAARQGRRQVEVSSTRVKTSRVVDTARAQAQAREEARAREAAEAEARDREYRQFAENRSKAAARMMGRLATGLSSGTEISMPGPGGEAYASYKSILKTIYERAWEARKPSSVSAEHSTVTASVTIARDGSIVTFRMLSSSGVPGVDRSIERVLRETTRVPPFPEGAKDLERTFQINFNVEGSSSL